MYPPGYRESKEWLAQNRELMIDCPKQPGNLLISKNACGKRHKASLNPDRRIYSEDSFGYALRQGLSLCRDCRIGKRVATAGARFYPGAFSGVRGLSR